MAGKWAFLKDKFPPVEEAQSSEYQQALNAAIEAHKGKSLKDLSETLTAARELKDAINEQLSEANLQITALERLIIDWLDASGVESITSGGYKLTASPEPIFAKRDGAALRAWAQVTGQEDLLTINSQTLTSLAKTYYLEHNEPPPGVELTGVHVKLSRTKSR